MPTIDESWDAAFCCAMVCPLLLFTFWAVAAAELWTELAVCDSDCSAVLAAEMIVLTLVIVVVNAEMLASCDRAAIAKPSSTPMPA